MNVQVNERKGEMVLWLIYEIAQNFIHSKYLHDIDCRIDGFGAIIPKSLMIQYEYN
jgi:hypothetical protein